MGRAARCETTLVGIGTASEVVRGGLSRQGGVSGLFKICTGFGRWAIENLMTFIKDEDLVELLVYLFSGLISVMFMSER